MGSGRSRLDWRWQWVVATAVSAVVSLLLSGFVVSDSRRAEVIVGVVLVLGGVLVGRWVTSRR
jgi:hypothetical protein